MHVVVHQKCKYLLSRGFKTLLVDDFTLDDFFSDFQRVSINSSIIPHDKPSFAIKEKKLLLCVNIPVHDFSVLIFIFFCFKNQFFFIVFILSLRCIEKNTSREMQIQSIKPEKKTMTRIGHGSVSFKLFSVRCYNIEVKSEFIVNYYNTFIHKPNIIFSYIIFD
jgi:hypothetical protein